MFVFVIKEIREKKDITLYRLSKMTGLSRTYLRNLENNKKNNPTIESLNKIAIALKVNIKDLFYSKLDIEELRKKMHNSIENSGISSPETLEISHIIDLLLNVNTFKK